MASLFSSGKRDLQRRAMHALALGWIKSHPSEAARLRAERAWLLGGAVGKVYGDNSAALHQYLRRHHPEISVYWVINRHSPDVPRALLHGPVLFRDDWRTMVRALLAEVIVISHGVHDVPGCSSFRTRAFKVRLGHGLTALKKTKPRRGHTNLTANAVFDLVPVCSEFEKTHKLEWGIEPARLVVTGLPRFDSLLKEQRTHRTDPHRILYMPTWRDSLVSSSRWEETPFGRGVIGFLTSPELHQLLERHGAKLDVFLHMNLAPYVKGMDKRLAGTPVQRITTSDPQRLFAEAGLLVTDYSSVAWDVLYLDKPVVFYHFDVDDHQRDRGDHLDFEEGLPGPVARTPNELIATLDDYLSGRLLEEPGYRENMEKWQQTVFAFRDGRNSERVTEAILGMLRAEGSRPVS